MMHDEFMKIAGYEVSYKDYTDIIEPMYMAVDLSKEEFVKTINKDRFALRPIGDIITDMQAIGEERKTHCTHFYDSTASDRLDSLITEYMERKGIQSIARYQIESKQIFSCYYPAKVVIYSNRTFETIETIEIA